MISWCSRAITVATRRGEAAITPGNAFLCWRSGRQYDALRLESAGLSAISPRRWLAIWISPIVDPAHLSKEHGEHDPWTNAMLRGDFAAAWRICDRVLKDRLALGTQCHTWPRHLQFIWDGTPIDDKRVLVRCYHGL